MELFVPSALLLFIAAAVVFFVLPKFGPTVLAVLSVGLLAFGIYQHASTFQNEYRLSTWQSSMVSFAPYLMVGGLLVVIAVYLLFLSPFGKGNAGATAPEMPEMPTVNEMPPANTATNALTGGINNALKGMANAANGAAAATGMAALGNKGPNRPNNKSAAPNLSAAAIPGAAITGAANAAKNAMAGLAGFANRLTGNTTKPNTTKPNGNRGPLGFPLSQV
jgi:hypothetical protein